LNSGHSASRSLASRGGAGVIDAEGGRLFDGGRPCDAGGGPSLPAP